MARSSGDARPSSSAHAAVLGAIEAGDHVRQNERSRRPEVSTPAPCGSWKSPITAELIVSGSVGLDQIALDGQEVYWIEQRPTEGGRNVVVRCRPDGSTSDVTPPPANARTRVHEYGGGAYLPDRGSVYYSEFRDQRLYRQSAGSSPEPVTPALPLRYADAVVDRARGRLYCVREDHRAADQQAVNTIVSLERAGDGTGGRILAQGRDFYASPRLSPDGRRLAWLCWNHPDMPWDSTELWVAELAPEGSVGRAELVAGGPGESIFQPEWSPAGVLHFVSDRTGWWNLYRLAGAMAGGRIEALCPMEAEFGAAQWVFGQSTYAFESEECIVCSYSARGSGYLATLRPGSGRCEPIGLPYTAFGQVRASRGRAVFAAGSPSEPRAIVSLDLVTGARRVLRSSSDLSLDHGYLSVPEAVEFPTEGGKTAHAIYYPPRNRDYVAPVRDLPPLLVLSHGGPTAAAQSTLSLPTQFWTSRGFAVLDVNYGGSTGYGREYRRRLEGQWGIVDVDDCCNGARELARRGLADPSRLGIRGGSAGGFTTLAALAFRDTFRAGASLYGVSDLEALARDTHKFESRYLDRLIGPYPARRDLYLERSPIYHTDRLSCPMILLQGLEDKVVPPSQAELMVKAVRAKGLPVAYLAFEGEQHGFRKGATIKRALEAELYFYGRIWGFAPADAIEPVEIQNLPDR
jgi:dipeptidyl aminopeptidase/acylaminoacyl peptidase